MLLFNHIGELTYSDNIQDSVDFPQHYSRFTATSAFIQAPLFVFPLNVFYVLNNYIEVYHADSCIDCYRSKSLPLEKTHRYRHS